MRVLVTGGTGFIGSHAVRALWEAGHEVRILARAPDKVAPLMVKMGVAPDAVDVAPGDITDPESVASALEGCDAVVHTAAVVGTDPTAAAEMERTNLEGARNVLGTAAEAGCDPIVHFSSVAALFPFETDPVTTDHPVRGDHNAYGRTKAACERFARGLQDDGHPVVTVYPSGVIGPDDWNESVALQPSIFWLTRGFPVSKRYSGSYVDVRDLARIVVAVMAAGGGPRRHLAMGTHLTAREQVAVIEEAIGAEISTARLPRPFWWFWSRLGDLGRRVGVDLIVTSDAYDYMFKSKPGDDSPTIEATGVEFRPVVETFADTFRWMYEAGYVEARHVGTLAR